jgi:hypothetical protein
MRVMLINGQSTAILVPALALVTLSLSVWVALVTVRPRAMIAARIPWQAARHTADLTDLPGRARDVADNYNHLMEQPTVFYGLVFYTYLAGSADRISFTLAWGYVLLRALHSIVQLSRNWVPLRFWLFLWSTLLLWGLAAQNLIKLFV